MIKPEDYSGQVQTLDDHELEIADLKEQIKQLKAQKEHLEQHLTSVLNSRSWKITSACRRLFGLTRSIFPLVRFSKVALEVKDLINVRASDGKLQVERPGPQIILKPVSGRRYPTGWGYLKSVISSEKFPAFFLLYFGKNGHYHPVNRVWITIYDKDNTTNIFRIPEWTTDLRLDPFNLDCKFSLDSLEVHEIGKLQMVFQILSGQVLPALKHPPVLFRKAKKFLQLLREGGYSAVRARFFSDDFTNNYQEWVKRYDTLNEKDIELIKGDLQRLKSRPKISVIMPVYNVAERWLRPAIESVMNQLYENWELCIADDCSTQPHVRKILTEYQNKDPARIKLVFREKNGHIAEASNSALELATGEYVALVDNDDELPRHALYMFAKEIEKHPDAALIYSDEDKITETGLRFNPYFKPDWNEELFLQQNFVCHLGVYKAEVVRKIGGFRKETAGAQDWDLALRVIAERGEERIRHIPHILYHWRVIQGSTAQSTSAKPYVLEAQKNSVENYLKLTNSSEARVEILNTISQLRVRFPVPKEKPLVSIIIPTKDQKKYLKRTIDSILEKTTYRNFEIIVINNSSSENDTLEYFKEIKNRENIRVIDDERPFNFSQLNNSAVKAARGEVIGFLNNDLEVISPDWLSEMLSHLYRPKVGAVGAKLYYPNDTMQHAGIVTGIGGVAGHSHKGRGSEDPGYFNKCILTQEMSGVTAACMLIKRSVFDEVGGLDETSLKIAFNDVDLCLKVRKAGYKIVYCPYAELYHYESISRGLENTPSKVKRFEQETETMKSRWKGVLENDPFYNPNLTLLTEDFAFAFPPRAVKPWRN